MKLNIIFDDRRIERYEPLMKELKRQGITDYELWPCIMRPDVVQSINASHKMLVRMAMENQEPCVCIGEDDLWFPGEDGWQWFLKNVPYEFDIYLGGTYCVPLSNNIICGFHLYMVHQKFYEKFLSVPDNEHIDTAMNNIKGDYHFCYPMPALQRAGFSSNNKTVSNYNSILKDSDVYGKFR